MVALVWLYEYMYIKIMLKMPVDFTEISGACW